MRWNRMRLRLTDAPAQYRHGLVGDAQFGKTGVSWDVDI